MRNAFFRAFSAPRGIVHGPILALAVSAGGCSADVTRFDYPAFGITDGGSGRPTGALPTPPEPVWQRPAYAPSYAPSYTQGYNGGLSSPRGAGLGDAPPAYGEGVHGYQAQGEARDAGKGDAAWGRAPEARGALPVAASGKTVEVRPGDTLNAIARRYGVSIAALIELNGLRDGASLRPGQRLALPGEATAPRESRPIDPPGAPAQAPGWDGHHTLKAGESLYGVARQYGVDLDELQRANGIVEPSKVRAGTVLSVPRGAELAGREAGQPLGSEGARGEAPMSNQQAAVKTAALTNHDHADDAGPPAPAVAAGTAGRFRWPVRGRVIVPFGARPDGAHNDGINIAVPLGTEIHAAESGRVAYAGSELKGYGNLVLIRHDNGWVSAYAHADQLLVKRDDVVRRGQVIGRAGKTGSVDQPQLHFELRQGAKPVDPLPHLER